MSDLWISVTHLFAAHVNVPLTVIYESLKSHIFIKKILVKGTMVFEIV